MISGLSPAVAGPDRHRLYELSVQNPVTEIDFIDRTFHELRGRTAHRLREDFCGTAQICCEWIRRRRTNHALGVDLDPSVLEWAQAHNVAQLAPAQRRRLALACQDVRQPFPDVAGQDVVMAMNFSYWLLRTREEMREYFRQVRASLATDGVFFLDAYGGYEAPRLITEERRIENPDGPDFTYVWQQVEFDPISSRLLCHIHFRFDDGRQMERAFSYEWRLWTLPEIRELLGEAGFSRILVYWQGWDEDGEPDGIFRPVETADADAGWIAYLTAEP